MVAFSLHHVRAFPRASLNEWLNVRREEGLLYVPPPLNPYSFLMDWMNNLVTFYFPPHSDKIPKIPRVQFFGGF